MPLQMDAADVYITKPGGISVTEAAKKRLPMILIDAVGGCEQHNLDYFIASGGALTAKEPEELAELALKVCENAALAANMQQGLEKVFAENDPERIYRAMQKAG